MANWDHADNIGTHPAYSQDPETRLRARLEAAQRDKARADDAYTTARNNLRVFLDATAEAETVEDALESKAQEVPC